MCRRIVRPLLRQAQVGKIKDHTEQPKLLGLLSKMPRQELGEIYVGRSPVVTGSLFGWTMFFFCCFGYFVFVLFVTKKKGTSSWCELFFKKRRLFKSVLLD